MGTDRLVNLPDCLLHMILASLGSRLAVQTSVLSRRWRRLWRDVPCVNIDEREFGGGGDQCWERFEDFADRMLMTILPGTRLDAFRPHLVSVRSVGACAAADRWIRRGLRHLPAAVEIHAELDDIFVVWKPHVPATGLCAAGCTQRLMTLRLVGVAITKDFVEYLGRHCPVLEELHVERCNIHMFGVSSPTLRRLVIVGPSCYVVGDGLLRLTAPRLASMRLETRCHGRCYGDEDARMPNLEPLPLLTQASIRLIGTRPYDQRPCTLGLLALLSNVVSLHLSGFTTTALLKEEAQNFPVLHNLKTLILEECDVGKKVQVLTGILCNTPNLEKLGLHQCTFLAPLSLKMKPSAKRRSLASHVSWSKNLKSIEMKSRRDDEAHLTKVLLEISKGMTLAQWRQVETSSTIV